MHGNSRPGSCDAASMYISGTSPSRRSRYGQTLGSTGYGTSSYQPYSNAKFRAKRGGVMLETGVLPAKPVQTASAATPLLHRRKVPKPEPVTAPAKTRPQMTFDRAAVAPPDCKAAPPPHKVTIQPDMTQIDGTNRNKSSPLIHRKRNKRRPMPVQSGIFSGIFTAMIAVTLGVFWWMENPADGMRVYTMPTASVNFRTVEPNISAQTIPIPITPAKQKADESIDIAGMQTDSTSKHISSMGKEKQPEAEQSRIITPEAQAAPVTNARIDSGTKPRSKTAEAGIESSRKTPVKADEKNNRTPRRIAITKGIERADEINRLKAQAFSETRKDRLGSAKPVDKTSASEVRDHLAAKRTSPNASQLSKRVNVASEFNECRRKESFLQREKCKWQVCAGKWGQNGCPAYKHDIASY